MELSESIKIAIEFTIEELESEIVKLNDSAIMALQQKKTTEAITTTHILEKIELILNQMQSIKRTWESICQENNDTVEEKNQQFISDQGVQTPSESNPPQHEIASPPPLEQSASNLSPNDLSPSHQQINNRQKYIIYGGKKTPEEDYLVPLLTALVELGGSARVATVIDRVGEMMKDKLNETDREKLSSNNSIRWKNTVQWLRLRLIERGYMSSSTPYGIWGISEKGRQYLYLVNNNLPNEDIL